MDRKKRYTIGIVLSLCAVAMIQVFADMNMNLQAESSEQIQGSIQNPLSSVEDLYIPEELQGLVNQSMQNYALKARAVGADEKISEPIQMVNPVVFIELKNADGSYDPEWITDENLAKAEQLYNGSENSLRAYYKKLSYGKLDIVSEFYPKNVSTGKVTSVKSPFYKSFFQPKNGAVSFLSSDGKTVTSYTENYDARVGQSIKNPLSVRKHEEFVYKYALEDSVSTGGSVTVAKQIGDDFMSDEQYDKLNSRYSGLYDFSSRETDFYFSSQVNASVTWPQFFQNSEFLSADAFTFVLRAKEEEVDSSGIYWPHKYAWMNNGAEFPSLITTELGKVCFKNNASLVRIPSLKINNAATVYADNNSGIFADKPIMGVMTHEFMHIFEAPDLYRLSYKGQAVGTWDLMGAQNDFMPQYPLQFTQEKYGLWPIPDATRIDSYKPIADRSDVVVNAPTYKETDEKLYYKIYPNTTDYVKYGEYFVVEYRKKAESGFDSQIPGSGLLVYRVNERIDNMYDGALCGLSCGNMFGSPDEIFMFRPNAANASLNNQSAIDPNLNQAAFPRTINGTKINSIGKTLTQVPASSTAANFDKDTLYFSDGSNSGLRIVNISDAGGDSMKFTVLYGDEPVPDTSIKLEADKPFVVTRTPNSVADNILTITGGEAPYNFQIESVQMGEAAADASLFVIDDTNTSDTSGILKLASGKTLAKGSYTVKVKVSDHTSKTQTVEVTYQVKSAYPTDSSTITFSDNQLSTSATANANAILGALNLEGCSDDGCFTDYGCDVVYRIEFLADKDYSQYFQMHPLIGSGSGQISAKKQIPAGTYPFKGIISFVDGDEETILANETLQLVVKEDAAIVYPTIDAPTGAILSATTWMKDVQTVSIGVGDRGNGLKSVTITTTDGVLLDNTTQTKQIVKEYAQADKVSSDTLSYQIKANGTYTIQAVNWDDHTNQETVRFTIDKLDCALPNITLQVSEVDNKRMATITTDDKVNDRVLSGIKVNTTKYATLAKDADEASISFDQTYTAPFEIATDFSGKLCAEVYDNSGNRAQTCTTIEKAADKGKPTLDVADIRYAPDVWTNQNITMSLLVEDDESGVKSIKVESVDGALLDGSTTVKSLSTTYETPELAQNASFILVKNGTYVITYEDMAGNEASTTITMKKIDKDAPIIDTFVIHDDGAKTSIDVTAKDKPDQMDEQSGVKQLYYQHVVKDGKPSASNWKEYPDADTQNWPSVDDGSICVYAVDNAGNASEESCKKFGSSDNTKPTIDSIQGLKDITIDASGWSNAASLEVSINASDTESGVKSVTLRKDGIVIGTPFMATEQITSINYKCDVSENGVYSITVIDADGNSEMTTFTVNQFDRDAPVIDHLQAKTETVFTLFPTSNNLELVAHDLPIGNHSGVLYYKYQLIATGGNEPSADIEDASWLRVDAGDCFAIEPDFEGSLYAYAFDKVGNKSILFTETIAQAQKPQVDTTLQAMSISTGSLSPTFNKDVKTYTAIVENDITTLQVTATPTDEHATMTISGNTALQVGNNEIRVVVENGGEETTYTINVTRKAVPTAHDVTLSSLTLSAGSLSPTFNKDVKTYTAIVENDITTLQVTAIATDANATATVSGNTALQVGTNAVSVVVKNGSEEATYTITVTRKETTSMTDVTLSSLSISQGTLSPSFQKATTAYSTTVENSVSKLTISATASDQNATVTGTGERSLSVGTNILSVMVKRGSEQKVYNITVVRKDDASTTQSNDASLKSLSVNKGSLSPNFNASTYQYQVHVDNAVESIRVMAKTNHSKAIVSGDVDKDISLKVGETPLLIKVRAEDGTTKEYHIVVTRLEQTKPDTSTEIVNKDNTIKVIGDLDQSLRLVTENIQSDQVQVKEEFHNDFVLEDVFDIYLEQEDGTKFNVSTEVNVRIALKEELKGKKNLIVVYIGDDGSVTNMPTTIYDDYVEFTTSHFSKYGIASTKDTIASVQTGDQSDMVLWVAMLAFAFVSFSIAIRKKVHEQ